MTLEGDLVLVHMEKTPAFFARIESITADVKPDWYHVKMLVLQVPLLTITWILREAYINGDEFTMGGRPVRLEKVVSPEEAEPSALPEDRTEGKGEEEPEKESKAPAPDSEVPEKRKVVSLADRRKKGQGN
ncbi:MAG: hypothetical protein ABFD98_14710 [Syntrophobacteraceae bacterium]|nr:hypothetical protein [Desulfobacteraceae bacterium]